MLVVVGFLALGIGGEGSRGFQSPPGCHLRSHAGLQSLQNKHRGKAHLPLRCVWAPVRMGWLRNSDGNRACECRWRRAWWLRPVMVSKPANHVGLSSAVIARGHQYVCQNFVQVCFDRRCRGSLISCRDVRNWLYSGIDRPALLNLRDARNGPRPWPRGIHARAFHGQSAVDQHMLKLQLIPCCPAQVAALQANNRIRDVI